MTPRLFFSVVSMTARRLMTYRIDFWIRTTLTFFIQFGASYFLWKAMFEHSGADRMAGFTFPGMLRYYMFVILAGKLVGGADFESVMSREVYDGSLSRYLLYPTRYLPLKYAERLGEMLPALCQCAFFAVLAPFVLPPLPESHVSATSLLMACVSLLVANLLNFVLYCPTEAVSFWADNVWSLNVLLRLSVSLLGGLLLPLTAYPAWAQEVLRWLPFQYIFYFPVHVALGEASVGSWLQGLVVGVAWCLVFSGLGTLIWRRGSRDYAGVGI